MLATTGAFGISGPFNQQDDWSRANVKRRLCGQPMSHATIMYLKRRAARATICVDMDEVIADTLREQIFRYNKEFSERLTVDDLRGRCIWDCVPPSRVAALERHIASADFYPSLSVVPDSQVVLERLQQCYEIYIATAVMEYPRSFGAKYDWLRRNFPFIQPSHIVFCGHKAILGGDFLIDDNPLQLRQFQGTGIMYDSPSNSLMQEFHRVKNWGEIQQLF